MSHRQSSVLDRLLSDDLAFDTAALQQALQIKVSVSQVLKM